jgi:Galactose oxidase, central domain
MRTVLLLTLFPAMVRAQEWTPLADLPAPKRDDAVALSIDQTVYVGTGLMEGWVPANDWWAYNGETAQWTQKADLPASPRQYVTAFTVNGTGFLFGGLDTSGALNQLWAYEPITDTWSSKAPLPDAGRYASVAFVIDGLAYVNGGLFINGLATNQTWQYDPQADAWTQRATLPSIGRHRAMAFAVGNRGYVVGGANNTYDPLSENWRYTPADDEWTGASPLPEPRWGGDGTSTAEGGAVVCGATDFTDLHSNVWLYDANEDLWTMTQPFAGGNRRGGVIAYLGSSGLYYGTGLDGLNRYSDWYQFEVDLASVQEQPGQEQLLVSPTLAIDYLNLTLTVEKRDATLLLLDMTGRSMGVRIVQPGVLSVAHLAPGRYTLVADHPNGRLYAAFVKAP